MMKSAIRLLGTGILLSGLIVASADLCSARGRKPRKLAHRSSRTKDEASKATPVVGTQLRMADGSAFVVDEAWEDSQGIWYKRAGITQLIERDRVRSIERGSEAATVAESEESAASVVAASSNNEPQPVWIYLKGGARVEADDATESADGVWYNRGALSVFIEKSRVDRVERETTAVAAETPRRGWSTGNGKLDTLIRQSGTRHSVDPYLIFLVMEEESHFNPRVVSPKGARGLMQLMPGTGARFGVRHPFNPAENIEGGTRYLKQLLKRFNGRVDLALASYNAGEGAVAKFGTRVPPYRETQNYVRRISKRYGRPHTAQTSNHSVRREGGQ